MNRHCIAKCKISTKRKVVDAFFFSCNNQIDKILQWCEQTQGKNKYNKMSPLFSQQGWTTCQTRRRLFLQLAARGVVMTRKCASTQYKRVKWVLCSCTCGWSYLTQTHSTQNKTSSSGAAATHTGAGVSQVWWRRVDGLSRCESDRGNWNAFVCEYLSCSLVCPLLQSTPFKTSAARGTRKSSTCCCCRHLSTRPQTQWCVHPLLIYYLIITLKCSTKVIWCLWG